MTKLKDIILVKAFKTYWNDGFYWFAYNVLLGLAPVWIVVILQITLSTTVKSIDLFSHGEFALYSAGLCAGTLFTVWQDPKMRYRGYNRFFALLSVIGLFLATLIFAGVFVATSQAQTPLPLNLNFLRDFTIWLYVGTVIVSLLTVFIDLYRVTVEPRELADSQFDELERSFNELGKKKEELE